MKCNLLIHYIYNKPEFYQIWYYRWWSNTRSDPPNLQITVVKLDGRNYLTWSQSALLCIKGKDKDKYLTGEVSVPDLDSPTCRKCKTEKAKGMSWLLHSTKPEISSNYLFFKTAKQIWDVVSPTYSENTL